MAAMMPCLDLTAERCPMTFVRVRLALDSLPAAATLRVRLRGSEAPGNVATSARALGCTVTPELTEGDETVLAIAKP